MQENRLPRMMTIRQTAQHTRPYGIGECWLRRAVREGKIVHVTAGRTVLINFDALLEYLARGEQHD